MGGDLSPALASLLRDMIPRAAARKRRELSGALSLEDLEQEMWLAVLEHAEVLEDHCRDGNEEAVRTILNHAAAMALRAEERQDRAKKAVAAGYKTQDEIFYSLGFLRRLLPLYFECGYRELAGTAEEYQVAMMDVGRAFKALPGHRQRDLKRYFSFPPRYMVEWEGSAEIHGFSHTEIANALGVRPDILGSRVHHALKSLQKELGGQNPWNRGPSPRKGKR